MATQVGGKDDPDENPAASGTRRTGPRPVSLYDAIDAEVSPPPGRLSPRGRRWLINAEGCRLMPYLDLSGAPIHHWQKGATIGVGHLIIRQQWPRFANGIDRNWAESLLRQDLQHVELGVLDRLEACRPRVGARGLRQHQFDALVLLAFNIGLAAFSSSSLVSMLCDPRTVTPYATLEQAWLAWKYAGGEVMAGLERRRAEEWRIFKEGDYGPDI